MRSRATVAEGGSAPPSPPVELSSSGGSFGEWAFSALLWLCIWSPRFTFVHIPKNGGTSIEGDDLTSPFQVLGLRASIAAPTNMSSGERFGGLGARWPGTQVPRCVSNAGYPFFAHWTPEQLRLCHVEDAAKLYPQGAKATYCVVRDPHSHFLSTVAFAQTYRSMWPRAYCGLGAGHARQPFASGTDNATRLMHAQQDLHCFLRACRHAIETYEAQKRAVLDFDRQAASAHRRALRDGARTFVNETRRRPPTLGFSELLHLCLPQSSYVGDAAATGEPNCELPFAMDDVHAAGIGHDFVRGNYASSSWRSAWADALDTNSSLRTELRSLYGADFALWERVRAREAATPRHRPLTRYLKLLMRNESWLQATHQHPPACALSPGLRSSSAASERAKICTHPDCCGRGASAFAALFSHDPAVARTSRPMTAYSLQVGGSEAAARRCKSCVLAQLAGPRGRASVRLADGSVKLVDTRRSS